MAIIRCPECNREVSTAAGTCPHCGYPLSGGGTTQANGGKIQTIEKTSKTYKLQKILSGFTTMLGLCSAIGSFYYLNSTPYYNRGDVQPFLIGGVIVFGIGFVWFIITSFLSWWHHG